MACFAEQATVLFCPHASIPNLSCLAAIERRRPRKTKKLKISMVMFGHLRQTYSVRTAEGSF